MLESAKKYVNGNTSCIADIRRKQFFKVNLDIKYLTKPLREFFDRMTV